MLVPLPGLDATGDLFAPVVDALGPNVPTQIVRYPLSHASDYAACEAIALILGKFATPALRKLRRQTLARLPPTTIRGVCARF
jgi:hypothetical protein